MCVTDPDASMATTARNRRLEPAYKQHRAVDDERGVILDVEVTTGELNEGQTVESVSTPPCPTPGSIATATTDAGYAYAKVFGALERRGIEALFPPRPSRSVAPCRCGASTSTPGTNPDVPTRQNPAPERRVKKGRFLYSQARDCSRCDLAALCLSNGRVNKAVVVSDDHPASCVHGAARAWSDEERRLYQRHRWRVEGVHGEAKTWHGLARAVRRGLQNMRIQAFLTAAAINLKRLAATLAALLVCRLAIQPVAAPRRRVQPDPRGSSPTPTIRGGLDIARKRARLLQRPHVAALQAASARTSHSAALSPAWSSATTNSTPCRPRSLSASRKSRQLDRLSRLASSTPSTLRRPSQPIADRDQHRLAADHAGLADPLVPGVEDQIGIGLLQRTPSE